MLSFLLFPCTEQVSTAFQLFRYLTFSSPCPRSYFVFLFCFSFIFFLLVLLSFLIFIFLPFTSPHFPLIFCCPVAMVKPCKCVCVRVCACAYGSQSIVCVYDYAGWADAAIQSNVSTQTVLSNGIGEIGDFVISIPDITVNTHVHTMFWTRTDLFYTSSECQLVSECVCVCWV